MLNHSRLLAPLLFISIFILLGSCGSNTGSDGKADFDRQAMLQNYGNNIIIPAYDSLQQAVDALNSSAVAFSDTASEKNLETLQQDLKEARLTWQEANIFQFGPAEMQILRASTNTYPADTGKVNSNIESGDYTLGSIDNQSAVGFPTLGYLLHGVGNNNSEIIEQYTKEENADNRMTYLLDNVSFIKQNTDAVFNKWNPSDGDYISTFTSKDNAGTDVGSSLGMLVNALVLHYERFLRDGKIGIPAGVRSAGVPRPAATEAYHGGYSLELVIANLEAIERLYRGTSLRGSDGPGLQDNLQALGADALSSEITSQLDDAKSALEQLEDPLSKQIEENEEPVLNTFEELQELVTLLKADMSSVLGVTITFQDNDGD